MTRFRPCIDLHNGKVKQIVGSSLTDSGESLRENHISRHSPAYFARLYRQHNLSGGHVILLGKGNDQAAREALAAWPNALHLGGGVHLDNAEEWIQSGAKKVIVTSMLFDNQGVFLEKNLRALCRILGKERIVVDLSSSPQSSGWRVASNRWQTLTNLELTHETLDTLAEWTSQYLIHATAQEGLCQGVDQRLIEHLAHWAKIPITYAGGIRSLDDFLLVNTLSNGRIDATVGSALDIMGGSGIQFKELVALHNRESLA